MSLPTEPKLAGAQASWVWDVEGAAIPSGILVDHGDHTMQVPWARSGGSLAGLFSLESLVPLTVTEQATCSLCAASGRIVEGSWLPADEVARG